MTATCTCDILTGLNGRTAYDGEQVRVFGGTTFSLFAPMVARAVARAKSVGTPVVLPRQ